MSVVPMPIEVFCAYAHEDEVLLRKLEKHLSLLQRQGLLSLWYDRLISPGTNWAQAIDTSLETASVILLLVSADFIASDYCYGIEMQRALERHQAGKARVLPIILCPCDWTSAPFAHLQALPYEGKAITTWDNQDEAFLQVVQGIRQIIEHRPEHFTSALNQQNRTRFLEKVSFRSGQLLGQSLHDISPISLHLRTHPKAVFTTTQLRFRQGNRPEQDVPADTTISQVYDQAGSELLILGAPGAGKTTLLLHLAVALQERARQTSAHPIPVIVNLSTWANARQPLELWLVDEIVRSYDVPRQAVAHLVQQEQILPLLDGFDEVPERARSSCVDAINTFKQTHWLPLVVCSRNQEYAEQPRRFTLHSAVLVQPLDEEQVDAYFRAMGKPLKGIRSVLQKNGEFRKLLTTPLMLHIVTVAYWDVSIQGLLKKGTLQQQQHQIFDHYVQRQLELQGEDSSFSLQSTRHWLSRLAWQMHTHNLTVLHLEQIQSDWLPSGRWQHIYKIVGVKLPGILVGSVMSMLIMTFFSPFVWPFFLTVGLMGGLIGGLVSEEQNCLFRFAALKKGWESRWQWLCFVGIANGLLIGGTTMLTLLLWGYWTDVDINNRFNISLIDGINAGLSSLLLSILLGAGKMKRYHNVSPPKGHPHRWKQFVLSQLRSSHLQIGILVGTLVGLSDGLIDGWGNGLSDGLSFGLAGIFLSLLLQEGNSYIKRAEIIIWSLQGLRQSLFEKRHLNVTFLLFLVMSIVFGSGSWLVKGLQSATVTHDVIYSLAFSLGSFLSTGLSIGLAYWVLLGFWNSVSYKTIDDEQRVSPNQGIWRSLNNGLRVGLVISIFCGFIGFFSNLLNSVLQVILLEWVDDGFIYTLHNGVSIALTDKNVGSLPTHDLSVVFFVGATAGLLAALLTGGMAWLHHWILRLLLWRAGEIPWQTIQFLNTSAQSILLYKDGGGYRFIHRLLLDYFADLELEQPKAQLATQTVGSLQKQDNK